MKVKFDKVALIFGALAFQLYTVTFSQTNYRGNFFADKGTDDAIQAFLIIAFFLFLAGFVLLLLENFAQLAGKIVIIITIIVLIVAVVCAVIGISIFSGIHNGYVSSYSMTSYATAIISGGLAVIFLFVKMCCG
jgi:lysylphosphatidylglycerol synthetase-like protein (DUF2156 family)